MDIYDEQVPFTPEQLEYLKSRFVSKNTAWNKLKSNIQAENIAIPSDWAKNVQKQMANTIALGFLKRLAIEGGQIVFSSECSSAEIALAYKEDRFIVDDDGYGYVLRPKNWKPLPMDV